MTVTHAPASRPWGLSRATHRLEVARLPYVLVRVDPDSQLARFYHEQGTIVEMAGKGTNRPYLSGTMSRPGDASKDSPDVVDDSQNDSESD
ncbi:putative ATP-grasp-modified RiPP [Nonomuraea endophytica]|uniref:Putative ATP-grasp target RiPP n=1 Tax=Nonomuraea endophytica TaxID=714136 RepID=A0A7W8EJ93_9ACTN|nr:putative ATP-grasp-modified RiPP [Nonomuraea endophytica]MBB5081399.1 putative ATP-grasp target RiPP [Nonomuraea endophytica]